jgi:hypothetical protein
MKYSEMVKFLNDNGICVMQAVIANEVSAQLLESIPEEEFENVCATIYDKYLDVISEPDIWVLVHDVLSELGYEV